LHHLIVKHGGVYKQYLEGKTFVTHIIASNLTPKKREEYQKYKVVRPEWIVDCVKAGKTLSWNQYRLIAQSSQATLGFSQRPADSYRAVSSREEKVVYGGGGLDQSQVQQEPSHQSSSYPTPPELKSMDIDIDELEMKVEGPTTMIYEENMEMEDVDNGAQSVSDLPPEPPIKVEEAPLEHLIPSDFSSIEISSPANVEDDGHSREGRLWQKPPVLTSAQVQPLPVRSPDLSDDVQDFPIQEIQETSITYEESPSNLPERNPTEPTPATDPTDKAAAHNAILLANPSLRQNTVINPTFLKSYFDQSRLHHLSTWKADLKTQMQLLTSSRPPRRHPKSQQRWIMHVDFDCFFCSVSLISRPELRDKPVCVGHGGGKSGEIASCNYVARKFGVHNGML
jgi:DNA repair protein REV1